MDYRNIVMFQIKKKPKTYYSTDGYKLQYQSIVVFDSCLIREML